MDTGDIETFFNENFFKKIPDSTSVVAREDKDGFMHGVPESAYEPTYPNANLISDDEQEVSLLQLSN
jgi:hypothetical protein